MLSREQILKASATRVVKIATPEWGGNGHVYVRMLPGNELGAAVNILDTGEGAKDDAESGEMIGRLCVLFICDAKGKRVFEATDTAKLLSGPLAPLTRCMNAALELNGMTEEAQDDILKNSQRGRSTGRGSGTRGNAAVRSRRRNKIRTRAK